MTDRPEALHATDRTVLRIAGPDARDFLQGLVTNDVRRLDAGSALCRPAVAAGQVPLRLLPRCRRPRRRAPRHQGRPRRRPRPAPRHVPAAGERRDRRRPAASSSSAPARRRRAPSPIRATRRSAGGPSSPPGRARRRPAPGDTALAAARVARGVPETGVELLPDDSYILELGFERLHGVDFRKGCYVGQEVTARMKHKAELRKGLARVRIEGAAAAARHRDPRRRPARRHPPHRRRRRGARLPALRPRRRPPDRRRRTPDAPAGQAVGSRGRRRRRPRIARCGVRQRSAGGMPSTNALMALGDAEPFARGRPRP